MASFLSDLKRQATADAEAGSVQSDVQIAIKTLDKLLRNPEATIQQLKGSAEATSFKTQLTQGWRELGKSLARVLGTKIPR